MKIEIFKGKGLQPWRFHAKAPNGAITSSSEGYLTKWNAKRAAKKVFGQNVQIIDLTKAQKR